jgi:hypothetical protein
MINISKPKKNQHQYCRLYWGLSEIGEIALAFGRAGGV